MNASKEQQDSGVCVARPPEGLPQMILSISRISNQEAQDADSAVDHDRQNDQEDSGMFSSVKRHDGLRCLELAASDARVNEHGECFAIDHETSPLLVISGRGPGRDDFNERFALPFQCGHLVTHGHEHVAKFDQPGFVADWAMARNNDDFVSNSCNVGLRGTDRTVNASAGVVVDEGKIAVPPGVADVQDVPLP